MTGVLRSVGPADLEPLDSVPASTVVDVLTQVVQERTGGVLTWLNHYSALQALAASVPLDEIDYLGLDGIFLSRIVRADVERTSADLVLPVLFDRTRALRIALIGSDLATLTEVAARIEAEYGHQVLILRDGYAGLPDPVEMRRQLQAGRIELAIVGLGAPRQDFYALELRSPGLLVATCGGWLDQYAGGEYYPSWAYPLRLNWLVRLCREPRRLWRRYTVDAIRAARAARPLTTYVTGLGGPALHASVHGRPLLGHDRPAASAAA